MTTYAHKQQLSLTVNNKRYQLDIYPMTRLLDVLRHELKITGPKEGCGEGECGACSVFVNQKLVNSCLVPVMQVNNAEILTIEGIEQDSTLKHLQKYFIDHNASQCGICTPGMIMAAAALYKSNPHANDDEIRYGLSGNLCRCTGYTKIISAVQQAFRAMQGGE